MKQKLSGQQALVSDQDRPMRVKYLQKQKQVVSLFPVVV